MKKVLITFLIIIIVGVLGFGGWGYWSAKQIKAYAKEIKTIMDESEEVWTEELVEKAETMKEMKKVLLKVKSNSEDELKKLNNLKVPKKGDGLQDKTRDYFETAKKISENLIPILEYFVILEEAGEDLESIDEGLSGSNYLGQINTLHSRLSGVIKDLEGTTPPDEYKNFHEDLVGGFKDLDAVLVKTQGYIATSNLAGLTAVVSELQTTLNTLNTLETPSIDTAEKVVEDKVSTEDQTKLNDYPDEIKDEANDLEKTLLCLFGWSYKR